MDYTIKPMSSEFQLPLYGADSLVAEGGRGIKAPNQAGSSPQDKAAAKQQLVQAGQQFEAYFVSYLLKVMRETVPEGAIANKQGAYFHSFYDQEIGMRAAQAGGIGIAQMVEQYAEHYFAPGPAQPSSSTR